MRNPRIVLAAVSAGALLLVGCGGVGTDKAGGAAARDVRVLRLANFNPVPGELEPFAAAVERASHGRLRIEFVNDWRKGEPNAEPGVFDDVRAGKVDLAWVGARAFKAEGVSTFDPLVAPFVVTDYATEEKVLTSPIAATMLDAVDKAGVEGVAILPGPLQRLGMREPWRSARDLRGKRIGAPAGVGGDALKALGRTSGRRWERRRSERGGRARAAPGVLPEQPLRADDPARRHGRLLAAPAGRHRQPGVMETALGSRPERADRGRPASHRPGAGRGPRRRTVGDPEAVPPGRPVFPGRRR